MFTKPNKNLDKWSWPRNPRRDKLEWDCPHGIGHGQIHGCDGCCAHPNYPENKFNENK